MGQIVDNSYKQQWSKLSYYKKKLWEMTKRKKVHVKELKKLLLHVESIRLQQARKTAVKKMRDYNKNTWRFSSKELALLTEILNAGKMRTVVEMAFHCED